MKRKQGIIEPTERAPVMNERPATATNAQLRALLADAGKALEPFEDIVAKSMQERIVDWFGPADFKQAAALAARIRTAMEQWK